MKNQLFKAVIALVLTTAVFTSCKKDEITPVDPNETLYTEVNGVVTITDLGQGTGNKTFTADKVWVLNGLVFVNSGQILTIEAGTVIKGKPGQGEDASALIVARGAKISAEGTVAKPIIFTALADQLNGNLQKTDRGLWGGLIILGNAKLNSTPGESAIEGISTAEKRGLYGGSQDTDNSGSIKYVSIRHGGTDIGEGNEINGLTLGGVGSGTTFDYIEVIANGDDGIEFFGGTPQLKHVVVAYCGDDCYDYDEGFRGKGQFWLAVQDVANGDRMGEHDGGTDPETAQPYAIPVISNVTYIGRGLDAGSRVITFRDNAGGKYFNSVFANQSKGIDIEILKDKSGSTVSHAQSSYSQWVAGNLKIENCIFSDVKDKLLTITVPGDSVDASGNAVNNAAGSQLLTKAWSAYSSTQKTKVQDSFGAKNTKVTLALTSESPVPSANVDGADFTDLDAWFTSVTYKGAFTPGVTDHWAKGWTLTYQN